MLMILCMWYGEIIESDESKRKLNPMSQWRDTSSNLTHTLQMIMGKAKREHCAKRSKNGLEILLESEPVCTGPPDQA